MTFHERIERLLYETELEGSPIEKIEFVWLRCNGCRKVAVVERPNGLWEPPEGWRIGGYGEDADYCSGCWGQLGAEVGKLFKRMEQMGDA